MKINHRDEIFANFQPAETSRILEDIEWSTTYCFDTLDTTRPRLLMIGDSICSGYHRQVKNLLQGRVNVSFWASSKCVTDPEYFHELEMILAQRKHDLISFNNGLHSLSTNREEWQNAYQAAVSLIRAKCPDSKLFITLCTPLKEERLTLISHELNLFVEKTAKENGLQVIDLFSLMNSLDREIFWTDVFHFGGEAVDMQAKCIADAVLRHLNNKTLSD